MTRKFLDVLWWLLISPAVVILLLLVLRSCGWSFKEVRRQWRELKGETE